MWVLQGFRTSDVRENMSAVAPWPGLASAICALVFKMALAVEPVARRAAELEPRQHVTPCAFTPFTGLFALPEFCPVARARGPPDPA